MRTRLDGRTRLFSRVMFSTRCEPKKVRLFTFFYIFIFLHFNVLMQSKVMKHIE